MEILCNECQCVASECPPRLLEKPPPGCNYEEYMGLDGCVQYALVCEGKIIPNISYFPLFFIHPEFKNVLA